VYLGEVGKFLLRDALAVPELANGVPESNTRVGLSCASHLLGRVGRRSLCVHRL
jgi:hypothetical protein